MLFVHVNYYTCKLTVDYNFLSIDCCFYIKQILYYYVVTSLDAILEKEILKKY